MKSIKDLISLSHTVPNITDTISLNDKEANKNILDYEIGPESSIIINLFPENRSFAIKAAFINDIQIPIQLKETELFQPFNDSDYFLQYELHNDFNLRIVYLESDHDFSIRNIFLINDNTNTTIKIEVQIELEKLKTSF